MRGLKVAAQYLADSVSVVSVEDCGDGVCATLEGPGPYPDGKGGQLGDRGTVAGVPILAVTEVDGVTKVLLGGRLDPGEYRFDPDRRRRFEVAQQHSGQHILSAAFAHVAEIQTVGFHMGEEYSTIDLDVPFIEKSVLDEVENLANETVWADVEIEEILTEPDGVGDYQLRKPVDGKVKGPVRLIKIGDFDVSACGGFHVDRTGQVGAIKIISSEKVKGQLTRVYAVCGARALRFFQRYTDTLRELSKTLTSSIEELHARVARLLEQAKQSGSLLSKLAEEYAKLVASNLPGDRVVYLEGYTEVGNFLTRAADLRGKVLVFFDGEKYTIASGTCDVRKVIAQLKEHFGGKGGGRETFGTYQPEKPIKPSLLVKAVESAAF